MKQHKAHQVLLYPLITEKAVNMIDAENKLCFVVDKKATKASVKKAVEDSYRIKVDAVKVLNDRKGRKKAVVKVNKAFKADEIATKLGVI
jgi:ribosomal protein L23